MILSAAEKEMQNLLEQAVQIRDYEALSTLGSWAAQLSRMLDGTQLSGPPPAVADSADRNSVMGASAAVEPPARERTKAPRISYPQFWREGNQLVKVGWSSANHATYDHKADLRIVESIAKAIVAVSAKRRRFQVQDLEKTQRASGNAEIPNYQLYVALAWLRWAGLVVQHGRQGYSLPAPTRFLDDLKSAWAQLSER
jgi:hypothetical protein